MKKFRIIAGFITALCAGEGCAAAYFYRNTMKRSQAKYKRTLELSGTDWKRYYAWMQERKRQLLSRKHEEIYIHSEDGLKLHGTYVSEPEGKRIVICFHGYTSNGMNELMPVSDYYYRKGFQLLLVDMRAHGLSEGEYIGFGCLDRRDGLQWIKWVTERIGEDAEILLYGDSMGGATVLMMSGLQLPPQVKGIISDCGFTSSRQVFTYVLHHRYHLPAFPLMQIADRVNRRKAGYGLDECNAAREVQNAEIPIMMVHGEADEFVPVSMCHEIYENIPTQKRKLIIPGAAHIESYFKEPETYEKELDLFIDQILSRRSLPGGERRAPQAGMRKHFSLIPGKAERKVW